MTQNTLPLFSSGWRLVAAVLGAAAALTAPKIHAAETIEFDNSSLPPFLSAPAGTRVVPGAELQIPTEPRWSYLIERSSDKKTWEHDGPEIIGDGSVFRRMMPRPDSGITYRIDAKPTASLDETLAKILARRGIPGMSAAVVLSNRIVALGAAGVRRSGVGAPVTITDKFHIGSCTKSMTASLAAMLVEEGKLKWTSRIADIFPEYASSMHPDYRNVTLQQLLVNRAGAPGDLKKLWDRLWDHTGSPQEQRLFLLRELTKDAPASPPGTSYTYSNSGFSIAGMMIEKAAGRPWEEVMRERLFLPLGMTTGGFGPPATPRHIDQPLGHTWRDDAPQPMEPGKSADNPPSIGPGGTVHCSVIDLARYAAWHVQGAKSRAPLLRPESFEKLHSAIYKEDSYAMGWSLAKRSWAKGEALTHTGSNNQWYTVIWLAPERDFAVVVNANIGGDKAFQACDDLAGAAIQQFLK